MFTDVVGYTALAQVDERAAMEMLEKHNELLRPLFTKYHGHEVKTIGDAFLVEFDSALEATECAIEIQRRLVGLYQRAEPGPKPLRVRIGIHVGDVIHQGGDVFGDAVNLASRVQPLADPDGICISDQVYAQVRNKMPYSFVLLPAQTLKNVQFAMNVYKVILPSEDDSNVDGKSSGAPRTRVAVLPFTNISPDPKDEYFADGVTEELITAISHVHDLRVIARTSTARYRGALKSIAEIGRELGVGSVLEGSTRMAGNKVRVTAQLIDTATEEHVWSDSYDRQLDDIFTIQSEIAKSVSEALKVQLLSGEEKRLSKKATESAAAYVRYLKGRAALRNRDKKDLFDAKKFFEDAISEDTNFAMAYVGLADSYFLLGDYNFMPTQVALQKSKEALSRALSLDENLAEARVALANSLQHEYKFAEATREYDFAVSLNPNYAHAHHWYAVCLWDMGRYGQAFEEISKAEELDPLSAVIAFNLAFALSLKGDRAKALEVVEKVRELDPGGKYVDLALSFMMVHEKNFAKAALYLERVIEKDPHDFFSLSELGLMYGLTVQWEKARGVLEKLKQLPEDTFGKPFFLAMSHGGLGEKDEMFSLLEKAFEERSLTFRAMIFDSRALGINEDPRYVSLLSRAGLPNRTNEM